MLWPRSAGPLLLLRQGVVLLPAARLLWCWERWRRVVGGVKQRLPNECRAGLRGCVETVVSRCWAGALEEFCPPAAGASPPHHVCLSAYPLCLQPGQSLTVATRRICRSSGQQLASYPAANTALLSLCTFTADWHHRPH
jgi:hypothetical protein